MISRGYKKGAGQANLRKKGKTNGLVGAEKRGQGRPIYGKKKKRMV